MLLESTMGGKYLVPAFGQITVARPLVVGVAMGSDRSRGKSNSTSFFSQNMWIYVWIVQAQSQKLWGKKSK